MTNRLSSFPRLLALGLFLAIAGCSGPPAEHLPLTFQGKKRPLDRPVRLILASDNHDDRPLLDAFVAAANRTKADLVVSLGDFQTYGTPNEWRVVDAGWKRLEQPLVAVPGNHDHRRQSRQHFAAVYGQVPRSLDVAGCHLVLLDDGHYELGDQLRFLERDLAAHADQRTLVVCHVPLDLPQRLNYLVLTRLISGLHQDDPHTPDHLTLPEPERSRLLDLLVRFHVDALVTGHLHSYAVDSLPGGIPSVHAGTIGGYLTAFGEPHSYLVATVTDRGLVLDRKPLDRPPGNPWALFESWRHYQRLARSLKGP